MCESQSQPQVIVLTRSGTCSSRAQNFSWAAMSPSASSTIKGLLAVVAIITFAIKIVLENKDWNEILVKGHAFLVYRVDEGDG